MGLGNWNIKFDKVDDEGAMYIWKKRRFRACEVVLVITESKHILQVGGEIPLVKPPLFFPFLCLLEK